MFASKRLFANSVIVVIMFYQTVYYMQPYPLSTRVTIKQF